MLKRESSEVVHHNPWWVYKHDIFVFPDGSKGDYYYGETRGNAMIIPILDDGRLVLVKQYRYLGGRMSVEFPCGGIEHSETPRDTAARELQEETGYTAEEMVNIASFEPLNGFVRDNCHVFLATELSPVAAKSNKNNEIGEVLYRRPDEFEEMIKHGSIWDGQTLAAWAIVRNRLPQA